MATKADPKAQNVLSFKFCTPVMQPTAYQEHYWDYVN